MTTMTKAESSTCERSCSTRQQTPLPQSPWRLAAQSFSPQAATTGSTPAVALAVSSVIAYHAIKLLHGVIVTLRS